MKAKYAGLLLASAVLMAVPAGVMAEESTEAVAVEMTADEQQDMSLEEQLFGYWSFLPELPNGHYDHQIDIIVYNGICMWNSLGFNGDNPDIGKYTLDGNKMTIDMSLNDGNYYFGDSVTVSGEISFNQMEESDLQEALDNRLNDGRYEYCKENMPTIATFIANVPDKSNPLVPTTKYKLYKYDTDKSFSKLAPIVLFDAEWELDNGIKMKFDSEGNTTITYVDGTSIESKEPAFISPDDRALIIKLESWVRYVIDELSVNEVTMHLQEDPTSITHMTRIQN